MGFLYFPYSGLVNAIGSLLVGFFVLSKNYKSRLNGAYALFALSVSFWALFYYTWLLSKQYSEALFFIRLCMIGAILIPEAFLYFVTQLIEENKTSVHIFNLVLVGIFISFSFNPIFIQRVEPRLFFLFWPVPGWLFHFMLAYFVLALVYAHALLWKTWKAAEGAKKEQLKYVLLGIMTGFIGGCTNYFLWYNIPFPPYLNILVSGFIAFVAYAIVKHQLMDIDVIVKKTLVFASLFAIVLGIFVGVTLLTQELIAGGRLLGLVISSIIIILIVRPIEDFLVKITNKYLFQKKYDYQQVLKAFIDEVITVLDLKKIVKGTLDLLDATIHPENVSILLLDENTDELVAFNDDQKKAVVQKKSEIFSYLSKTKKILVIKGDDKSDIPEALKKEMTDLAIHIAVPLYVQDDIIGIMLFGKKKSDESYTQEDISILTDLARTEAIAVKNAQFYEKSRKEIADKSERKGIKNVAIGASHQMYNALANVQTIAELMHEEIADADLQKISTDKAQGMLDFLKNELEILLTESQRGRNMLRSILDRAKAREAFKEIDLFLIASRAVERSAQTKIKEMIKEGMKAPDILNNIPSSLPHMIGNEHLIEEVLINLINNSFDAITDRYMHIKPDNNFKGKIVVGAEDAGKIIKIYVEDNGIGMKDDVKDKLFAAYFTTKATSQKGFGAGLFSLREWIEQHNGKIYFESEYGKGTTFYVELPKTQEEYHGKKNIDS